MIIYSRGSLKWHFIYIFQMRGSLFPLSFLVAFPCAAAAYAVKYLDFVHEATILTDGQVWNGFSFLVGFLIVFRTSQAYSRFWDGCTATHQMRAEWIDAVQAIMAFTRHSKAAEEDITKFKHLIVRLFSILHAMALGEIEDSDTPNFMAFDFELIDPNGVDADSWKALKDCKHKAALVFQWIQSTIVENIGTGVLSIPPPILSRVFQELANGMVALHEAQKISSIPFPFPYAQTCDALLILHGVLAPFVTAQWVTTPYYCSLFTFVQVFILWSLNNIAVEIENPFGNDANDLDASQMQTDMNMNLLLLLHPAANRTPNLNHEAVIHGLVSMGARASHVLDKAKTFNQVLELQKRSGRTSRRSMVSKVLTGAKADRVSLASDYSAFWQQPAAEQTSDTAAFAQMQALKKQATFEQVPHSPHSQANSSPVSSARLANVPEHTGTRGPHVAPWANPDIFGDTDPNPLGSTSSRQPAGDTASVASSEVEDMNHSAGHPGSNPGKPATGPFRPPALPPVIGNTRPLHVPKLHLATPGEQLRVGRENAPTVKPGGPPTAAAQGQDTKPADLETGGGGSTGSSRRGTPREAHRNSLRKPPAPKSSDGSSRPAASPPPRALGAGAAGRHAGAAAGQRNPGERPLVSAV